MQNNEIISTDARTFPEIWASLNKNEQSELRFVLIRDLDITRQTIANWSKGVQPIYKDTKKKVATIVGRNLGISVSWLTLFPAR